MNYYYLISSLPDLSLDVSLEHAVFEETFDSIKRNLEPGDLKFFNYLIYPNDNRNLLNHLFHEYKELRKGEFLLPATLSQDVVLAYRREQASFPNYLSEFLKESEAQFPAMTMREMENRLWQKFEDELWKIDNTFIKDYYQFKRSLVTLVAAFNHTNYDFLSELQIQSAELNLPVGKGQAFSSALLKTYPYAERLKEVVSTKNPSEIEQFVEQIEWNYLEGSYNDFGSEQVLAYSAQLLILIRKKKQDAENGVLRLDMLKNEIRNQVHSPKIPVV